MVKPNREPDFTFSYGSSEIHWVWIKEGMRICSQEESAIEMIRVYEGKLQYKSETTGDWIEYGQAWYSRPQKAYDIWKANQILLGED